MNAEVNVWEETLARYMHAYSTLKPIHELADWSPEIEGALRVLLIRIGALHVDLAKHKESDA